MAGRDWPKLVWVLDDAARGQSWCRDRDAALPAVEEHIYRGGRYGAHNLHENRPAPPSAQTRSISDLFQWRAARTNPSPIASSTPPGCSRHQINDVYATRTHRYAVIASAGYVLEMTVGGGGNRARSPPTLPPPGRRGELGARGNSRILPLSLDGEVGVGGRSIIAIPSRRRGTTERLVGREFAAPEAAEGGAGPVLVEIMRAIASAAVDVLLDRRQRQRRDRTIVLAPRIEHPDQLRPVAPAILDALVGDDQRDCARRAAERCG